MNRDRLGKLLKGVAVLLVAQLVIFPSDSAAINEGLVAKKVPSSLPNSTGCYGLNINFVFIANRYKEPWIAGGNYTLPFNFANSFDFDFLDKIRSQVTYARIILDSGETALRILFFSADNKIVFQQDLQNSRILECGPNRTVVFYSYSVSGSESLGGSDRRVTVVLSSIGQYTRVETMAEAKSRWLLFTSPTKTRETWGEFGRYQSPEAEGAELGEDKPSKPSK